MTIDAGVAVHAGDLNNLGFLFTVTICGLFVGIIFGYTMFTLSYARGNQRRNLFLEPARIRLRFLGLAIAYFCSICGMLVMVAYFAVFGFHGFAGAAQRQG